MQQRRRYVNGTGKTQVLAAKCAALMRELQDAVDSKKHVCFATGDLHFGTVEVHEALRRFYKFSVASRHLCCGMSFDTLTLQATM